ncbi:tetratricopeptide repeat protein [Pseudomonas cichorii]|nr:tetratricopeptide repeat protein [Pseudomonas cichorii]
MRYKGASIFIFLVASVAVYAGEKNVPPSSSIIKTIDVDLVPKILAQKILIAKNGVASADDLILTGIADGKEVAIVKTQKALPHIKNAYSPDSFDGFDVSFSKGADKQIQVVDIQGETTGFKDDTAKSIGTLNLVSREEDNGAYRFNVQFQYDDKRKKLVVARVLYVKNNESCDHSVLSAYAILGGPLESEVIDDFDGVKAFDSLKQMHINIKTGKVSQKKLIPNFVEATAELALAAYKKGDKSKLKEQMSYLLADGGNDESCAPETYIAEKYYFQDRLSWSNDLGFLFAESGYYGEAIELLKRVILAAPDRTVAYLTLADAYWAVDKKEQAIALYEKYFSLMQGSGKSGKVPDRVKERVAS